MRNGHHKAGPLERQDHGEDRDKDQHPSHLNVDVLPAQLREEGGEGGLRGGTWPTPEEMQGSKRQNSGSRSAKQTVKDGPWGIVCCRM